MTVQYFNLTKMTPAEREELYKREGASPVTYKTQDGKDIVSTDVHRQEKSEIKGLIHVPDWEPMIVVRRDPGPRTRGRQPKDAEMRRLRRTYEDWVISAILGEMGATPETVTEADFESCLKAVALEKGWKVENVKPTS